MRTHSEAAHRQPPAGLAGLFRTVNRFFFHPADSATFGLIRICGGLLVLYVHLVYSFDLYKFFGKDAWVDAGTMTEIRTNVPWQAPPMGWRPEPSEPLRPPRSPEEARQIAEYVRWWGSDPRLAYAHRRSHGPRRPGTLPM